MKELRNWGDLEEFGISHLTGEACSLGQRSLCDVTKRGQQVLQNLLGCELKLSDNWNSGSPHDPHIGSIMLPREWFQAVALWCLLSKGAVYAEVWIMKNGSVRGMIFDDLALEQETGYWRQHEDQILRKYTNRSNSLQREIHAFTGRLV
jgi:hypothetical protein